MELNARRRAWGARVILGVAVLLYLSPLLWLLSASIKSRADALSRPAKLLFRPTSDHFRQAFLEHDLGRAVGNSLYVAFGVVLVTFALAIPLGFAASRNRLRHSSSLFWSVLASRMVPAVATAVPLYWICLRSGLLDTLGALILANVTTLLAVALWLTRVAFDRVPRSVDDAGRADGLSGDGALLRLVLPQSLGGILVAGILVFAAAWGELATAAILVGFERRPVSLAVLGLVTPHGTFWGQIGAISVVMTIPALVVAVALCRWWRR